MKYFVTDSERTRTVYHEFYKGKWDEKTFWAKDSISLHDDILVENPGFYNALKAAVPGYDPCEMIEVSKEAWEKVREYIPKDDVRSLEIYDEADEWAKEAIAEKGCFTILGL